MAGKACQLTTSNKPEAFEAPQFPYHTGGVTLELFDEKHIGEEYLDSINDKEHMRFSEQRHRSHDSRTAMAHILAQREAGNFFLAVRINDVHIGNIGVDLDRTNRRANISILIFKGAVGAGYGKKAFAAAIEFCKNLNGVSKIEAGTMADNFSMIALMTHAGMQPDGMRARHYFSDGVMVDCVYYAIHKDT